MKVIVGNYAEFDTDTVTIDSMSIEALSKSNTPWVGKAVALLSAINKASSLELLNYDSIDITDLESLEKLAFEVNPNTRELYEELKPLRSWLNNLVSFKELKTSKKPHKLRVNQMYSLIIETLAGMISIS